MQRHLKQNTAIVPVHYIRVIANSITSLCRTIAFNECLTANTLKIPECCCHSAHFILEHLLSIPYGPLRHEISLLYSPNDTDRFDVHTSPPPLSYAFPFRPDAKLSSIRNQHLRSREKERQTKGTQHSSHGQICLIIVPIPRTPAYPNYTQRPTLCGRSRVTSITITRSRCYMEGAEERQPVGPDVSEIALDPASWTFYFAFGTFEHPIGGELQPLAKMRGLDRA